jgi:hypothetical protein
MLTFFALQKLWMFKNEIFKTCHISGGYTFSVKSLDTPYILWFIAGEAHDVPVEIKKACKWCEHKQAYSRPISLGEREIDQLKFVLGLIPRRENIFKCIFPLF